MGVRRSGSDLFLLDSFSEAASLEVPTSLEVKSSLTFHLGWALGSAHVPFEALKAESQVCLDSASALRAKYQCLLACLGFCLCSDFGPSGVP